MILLAFSFHLQALQDLHDLGSQEERNPNLASSLQGIGKILCVQINFEATFKVIVHYTQCLCLQDIASCQAAANRVIDELRVNACLRSQNQCFLHRRNVQRHDDLVGEFGDVTASDAPDSNDRLPH